MDQNNEWREDRTRGQIRCPGCGNNHDYYDGEHSEYFACSKCCTFFRAEHGIAVEAVKNFFPAHVEAPIVPIGTKGTIRGKDFRIVSMMVKYDKLEGVSWREYLLTITGEPNYYTLVEVDGNWLLVWKTDIGEHEVFNTGYTGSPQYELRLQNPYRRFGHYTSYTFEIKYAVGEFDWNIIADENTLQVDEYLAPPEMAVEESKGDTQSDWYWGVALDREEVADALGKSKADLPAKKSAGTLEVPRYYDSVGPLFRFTLIMVALVLMTQFVVSSFKPSGNVLMYGFSTVKDTATWGTVKAVTSPSFEIKNSGGVTITMTADVVNDWIELGTTLVNEKTGKEYEFTRSIEYYSGYDGGESWSEGSPSAEAVLSGVPAGTYHLNIAPYCDNVKSTNVSVSVEESSTFYSNIWWTLLIILLFPTIQYIRKNNFETQRWVKS